MDYEAPRSAVDMVRHRPDLYFGPRNRPFPGFFVGAFVHDAARANARLTVNVEFPWLIACSDVDWMTIDGERDLHLIFTKMINVREIKNYFRHEVLLNATSPTIYACCETQKYVKGRTSEIPEMLIRMASEHSHSIIWEHNEQYISEVLGS